MPRPKTIRAGESGETKGAAMRKSRLGRTERTCGTMIPAMAQAPARVFVAVLTVALAAALAAPRAQAQIRILNGGHKGQGAGGGLHLPQVPVPPPPKVRLPDPPPAKIQQIIREFTANESRNLELLAHNYTYDEHIDLEVLDNDGNPTGQSYRQADAILFSPTGRREIVCTWCPQSTLQNVILTEDDLHDFFDMDFYTVKMQDLADYDIRYIDHEKLEDLTAYRFSIKPKKILKGHRYFAGTVWVDDHYLQIVKSEGKAVPDQFSHGMPSNIFLPFTTYRQVIDGKYWFPVYTSTDSRLPYYDGKNYAGSTRLKLVVQFTKYKRYGSSFQIQYKGLAKKPAAQQPPAAKH